MVRTRHAFLACASLSALACAAAFAASPTVISQEGRAFAPGAVTLKAGETLRVVNDDRFVHNVHSKTDGFDVDSKVQRPGDEIDIYFRERGYYELGCYVHPKMKLEVTVE